MSYFRFINKTFVNTCRRYVPEVRRLPTKYVHEPWKAPIEIQTQARCVVGFDYPEPMCDHIKRRQICVQKLKEHSRELITQNNESLKVL